MNASLFDRASGNLSQNAFASRLQNRLLHAFRPAPQLRFDGGEKGTSLQVPEPGSSSSSSSSSVTAPVRRLGPDRDLWAHQAGINALALERFEGRILISGGSDATIRIWDLEEPLDASTNHVYHPVAQISRAESSSGQTGPIFRRGPSSTSRSTASRPPVSQGHRFGVTHLSFYPFDAAAFLSSSYDQTLKLWATETARLSGSFNLDAKIYSHAISPIADHLLVACATQHPAVRLVDLRSGAAVQSLVAPGQVHGAVLTAAWSPRHEHVLASGSVDGTVRIWDVRRASSLVALLDQEDSRGVTVVDPGGSYGHRISAKAHSGPVNGLTWTDDGNYLVSAGHDRRIRVWDAATGANTLVSFGPSVRNGGGMTSVDMVTSPTGITPAKQELLFWPNETEIVVFGLHDGRIITRLRGMGPAQFAVRLAGSAAPSTSRGNPANTNRSTGTRTSTNATTSTRTAPTPTTVADRSSVRKNRVTSLVWRGAGGAGSTYGGAGMGGHDALGGLYSGHLDGQIRAWIPRTEEEDVDETTVGDESEGNGTLQTEERDRKRRALDQAYRSLMGTQITFR